MNDFLPLENNGDISSSQLTSLLPQPTPVHFTNDGDLTELSVLDLNPIDIMNHNAAFLDDYDENFLQAIPQPTPIGVMVGERDDISKEYSVEVACNGYRNEIMDDIVYLLSDESRLKKRPLLEAAEILPDISNSWSNSQISFLSPPPTGTKKKRKTNDVPQNGATNSQSSANDFHGYQCEKWDTRLQELLDFKKTHGHCNVPNVFPLNPQLAQWVKRQRYQHKLKAQGKRNTLTDARKQVLDMVGFVWDSHEAAWAERWNELQLFFVENGHSNVPTNFDANRQLWIWVKCQRRQHKLYQSGRPSNITMERIVKMESLNFNWNPRRLNL